MKHQDCNKSSMANDIRRFELHDENKTMIYCQSCTKQFFFIIYVPAWKYCLLHLPHQVQPIMEEIVLKDSE